MNEEAVLVSRTAAVCSAGMRRASVAWSGGFGGGRKGPTHCGTFSSWRIGLTAQAALWLLCALPLPRRRIAG